MSVPVLCNQVLHTSIKKPLWLNCVLIGIIKKTTSFLGWIFEQLHHNYNVLFIFFLHIRFLSCSLAAASVFNWQRKQLYYTIRSPTFFAPNDSSTRGQLYGKRWVHLTKGASHSAHTLQATGHYFVTHHEMWRCLTSSGWDFIFSSFNKRAARLELLV